jgi:hypothetical protein
VVADQRVCEKEIWKVCVEKRENASKSRRLKEIQTIGSGRNTWRKTTHFGEGVLREKFRVECTKLLKPEVLKQN